MAATTNKRKASPTKRKTSVSKKTKAQQKASSQLWEILVFAAGLLTAALVLIDGDKMWLNLHNFILGLFSWVSYILPILLIYISVLSAGDDPLSHIKIKFFLASALILAFSGASAIFSGAIPAGVKILDILFALFENGKYLRGGGAAGFIFAFPLVKVFGLLGAQIFVCIIIFVLLMLVTRTTLMSFFSSIKRPIAGITEVYAAAAQTRKERPAKITKKEPLPETPPAISAETSPDILFSDELPIKPTTNIDIDIEADFATREASETPLTDPEDDDDSPYEISADNLGLELFRHKTEYISTDNDFDQDDLLGGERVTGRHPLDDQIGLAPSDDEPEIDEIFTNILQGVKKGVPAAPPPRTAPPVYSTTPTAAVHPSDTASDYRKPPIQYLKPAPIASAEGISEELKRNAEILLDTLKSFGVQTRILDVCRGPAVTRYEVQPSAGVKISKITSLADDIALNLASGSLRIEAPIPNKAAVGIEIPNKIVSIVGIRELIDSPQFKNSASRLTVALGKDITGNTILADLAKMPHVLIAGATGSGKSVCINSIIISLLYKASPNDVKLLMIDPKIVELGIYNGIPHLLVPVVTDPKKAAGALNWAVLEMEHRYKTFAENSVRDLGGFNNLAARRQDLEPMPSIVVIIDELHDLMMTAPGDVEAAICRLAQKARAAGMYLVVATQRPSVDVITGIIKANIPSRIAFKTVSQVDSRTIIDTAGADKLLGKGDMLFFPTGADKPTRVQGCFVTDAEVEKVVGYIKEGESTEYDAKIIEEIDSHIVIEKSKSKSSSDSSDDEDSMLSQAVECVIEMGQASTSMLQRRLRLGYARAARIIDQLETRGVVGPGDGAKPRQILISKARWDEIRRQEAENSMLDDAQISAPF